MSTFYLETILQRVTGRLQPGTFMPADRTVTGVSTDTRTLAAGELFVTLSGPSFDAHDFIATALEKGASAILCSRWPTELPEHPITSSGDTVVVIFCEKPLAAYQEIARLKRELLQVPVIAITGSVGKTSTRGMIAACLSSRLKVHQTRANLNNEIGLPSTLLATPDDAKAVVVEMGMRAPGEIAILSRIACPDIAVITNIGHSHIEFLGSQEGILKAKLEITEFLAADGLLILNADDQMLLAAGRDFIRSGARRVAFVSTRANFHEPGAVYCLSASEIVSTPAGVRFSACLTSCSTTADSKTGTVDSSNRITLEEVGVHVPSPGIHQVVNALFGLMCSHAVGVSLSEAAFGAESFSNTGSRQRIIRINSLTVMDDSYNASPESMQAAILTLQTLAAPNCGRLIGVLGGMLELGDYATQAHELVGKTAAKAGFGLLFVTGPHAADVARGALAVNPEMIVIVEEEVDKLTERFLRQVEDKDFILVKGSRSFHMERVVAAIEAMAADGDATEHERKD